MNGAWRFRRCPACFDVVASGSLIVLKFGRSNWRDTGWAMRRCPTCGHVAQTHDFAVVEDHRRKAAAK
jgi:hypothetical protein